MDANDPRVDLEHLDKKRLIRDGVADEIVRWLESLLHRVEKVENELKKRQSGYGQVLEGLDLLRRKKRQLETLEETIDMVLERHGRADLNMLIHFANELRDELLSLSKDMEILLSGKGQTK